MTMFYNGCSNKDILGYIDQTKTRLIIVNILLFIYYPFNVNLLQI